MSLAEYDLVVIGSGPAGQKAALSAAKLGKSVAVIERTDSVGGVCIHTGTIPSKAIREAVLHLTGLRERSVYGASYAVKHHIHMSDLLYRSQHVVRTEVEVIRNQMERNEITLISGSASFVDANTINVTRGEQNTPVRGKNILVAVGNRSRTPRIRSLHAQQSHRQHRSADAFGTAPKHDRRRRWRDRHRIRLHARSHRRPRHADRIAPAAARVRR